MQQQIKAYYRGKDKVAEMMGKDPATFTEKDLDVRKHSKMNVTTHYSYYFCLHCHPSISQYVHPSIVPMQAVLLMLGIPPEIINVLALSE